nr:unnamed protein product [Naegleria fowleri]
MERATEREREISDRLEKKEKEIERLSYEHRQKMFKEMEEIQRKNQAIARERQLLEMKKAELDDKARRLDVLASQTAIDMKSEMSLMRANLERENIAKIQKFEEEKRKLELEKEKLAEMMKKHSDTSHLEETIKQYQHSLDIVKSELHESRKRIRDLEEMNDQMRMQISLFKETNNDSNKPNNRSTDVARDSLLQREIENLTNQLKNKELAFHSLQEKMLVLERSENFLKTTLEENEREKKKLMDDFKRELLEEKQKTKKILTHWQNTERNPMVEKLQKERVRTERMQRDLEEQYLQNRTLQHEIDRLRNLLELPRISSNNGADGKSTKFGDISQIGKPIEFAYPSSLRDDNIYERLSLNDYPQLSIHDKLKEIDKIGMSLNRDFNLVDNTQKNKTEMNTIDFTPSMMDEVSSSLDDSFLKTFDSKTAIRSSIPINVNTRDDKHVARVLNTLENQFDQKFLNNDEFMRNTFTTLPYQTEKDQSSPLIHSPLITQNQQQTTFLEESLQNDLKFETTLNSKETMAKEALSTNTKMNRLHDENAQEIRASNSEKKDHVQSNSISLEENVKSAKDDVKQTVFTTLSQHSPTISSNNNSPIDQVAPSIQLLQQKQQNERVQPSVVISTAPSQQVSPSETFFDTTPGMQRFHENSHQTHSTTSITATTDSQSNPVTDVSDRRILGESMKKQVVEEVQSYGQVRDQEESIVDDVLNHEEHHLMHQPSPNTHGSLDEEEEQTRQPAVVIDDPITTSASDQQVYDHFGVGNDDDLLNTTHSDGWKSDTSGFSAGGGGFNDDDLDIEDQLYAKSEYDDF